MWKSMDGNGKTVDVLLGINQSRIVFASILTKICLRRNLSRYKWLKHTLLWRSEVSPTTSRLKHNLKYQICSRFRMSFPPKNNNNPKLSISNSQIDTRRVLRKAADQMPFNIFAGHIEMIDDCGASARFSVSFVFGFGSNCVYRWLKIPFNQVCLMFEVVLREHSQNYGLLLIL